MADAVAHFMREIGVETMAEGDVYITNDPWMGTGHLHDITVVTPAFHQGRHVGFFGCTAHVVDIGGRGFGADGNSIYEEGIQIPIIRLFDRGVVNDTLIALLRQNIREPDQVIGDIYALATCNGIGQRRLSAMLAEYGLPDLSDLASFILAASRDATLARIAALPRARASATMQIDGFANPITLAVTVETHGTHVSADWAGTSAPDPKGINVPMVYTKAYACYALKCAIAPEIPNNADRLRRSTSLRPKAPSLTPGRRHRRSAPCHRPSHPRHGLRRARPDSARYRPRRRRGCALQLSGFPARPVA